MTEHIPNEKQSNPTRLPSKARMIPSVGRYRNAVSSWPQLLTALDKITGDLAAPASLLAQYGAPFGSPASLTSMLAVNPDLLQSPLPPSDIYSRLVWLATKVSSSAKTMENTLMQLPSLLESATGSTSEQTGKLVTEILAGDNGLKQTADTIADLAESFMVDITNNNDGGEQMLASHRAIAENVKQHADKITALDGASKAQWHTDTSYAAHNLRNGLDAIEISSAHVTIAAVMSQLAAALKSMASAWRTVSADMNSIASSSNPNQLADPDYLRNVLDLDDAVADWKAYFNMVQTFIRNLLTIN